MKLTKRVCDAAKYPADKAGRRHILWDSEVKGFGLRVYPSGAKTYVVQYATGDAKRLGTVAAFDRYTVDEARKQARALRVAVDKGADPVAEARAERAAKAGAGTVADLFEQYAAAKLTNPRTAADAAATFKKNCARLGKKKAGSATADDIAAALRPVRERGATTAALHLWQYLHAAFRWGRKQTGNPFRLGENPVALVPKPEAAKPGERALSDAEIRDFWGRLDAAGVDHATATALRLLVVTGQRVEEILGARWSELDLDRAVLDIPPARLKTGRKKPVGHVVPLSATAVELFRNMPRDPDAAGDCVFPKRGTLGREPMPYATLTRAVTRLYAAEEGGFTPRDIRRSVKTMLSAVGVLKEIRDRVQNHSLQDVASKHYDRFDHLDDKRAALVGWEWELKRILAGRPTSEEWRRWLRRFVREPDNPTPARNLKRLLTQRQTDNVVRLPAC